MYKITIVLLLILCASFVHAQSEQPTRHQYFDSTNATVTWVAQTPPASFIYLQVLNQSTTTDVFVATSLGTVQTTDTTGTGVIRLYPGTNKYWQHGLVGVTKVWIKCASSTARVHTVMDYP